MEREDVPGALRVRMIRRAAPTPTKDSQVRFR
jgi:hypothetical protein